MDKGLTSREQRLDAQTSLLVGRDVLVQEMRNEGGHLKFMFISQSKNHPIEIASCGLSA